MSEVVDDDDDLIAGDGVEELPIEDGKEEVSGKFDKVINDGGKKYRLTGMYKEWFLDYASYVILERAVPHISDGLKPVQRRILHAMKQCDDGRLNKVASLVGATMPYHPHGDASIKDAIVQLGQKELLIDCQGNWGNILTGDAAAAGRYIEARLTEFANEVVFNPKTTEWVNSYDGRNREPVNLPVKFPLLLAQGSEGIAVGLACKILPHNFNELIDASISYLKGEDFVLEPDFPTGAMADISNYNHGLRGGRVRIRSKIEKINKNTLVVREIPYGRTTSDIIDSILKANEKGKIRIKRVDDNTAEFAEIVIQLPNDVSPDKTIDALYACTDCEFSISPNSCVIKDGKPQFLGVDEILKYNTDYTKQLLKKELEIKLAELGVDWHNTSLEKIFFENKVYKTLENDAKTWEKQLKDVKAEMLKYQDLLRKKITDEDILRLVEKPVKKISKFDIKTVEDKIRGIEDKEKEIHNNLDHLVDYTISYFTALKKKYGAKYPRRTQITSFENIAIYKVVANNAKLYVNWSEGFIGTSQKKIENAEYVCDCSDIDDIIVFLKDGRFIVKKVTDKQFVERNIIHAAVFVRGDERTVYNVAYKDGKGGTLYAKRFAVPSVSRDKWYDITRGKEGSSISWFTCNHNGEAGTIRVFLRPKTKLKKLIVDFDFATLAIKNRNAMGNIVTKNPIQKIVLRAAGVSTIGGKQMWFDWDVLRLNEDGRGEHIGEFKGEENILSICKSGTYTTCNLDLSNRFPTDVTKIEKLDTEKVCSVIYWDGTVKSYYLKRFHFDPSNNIVQSFISDAPGSRFVAISDDEYPQVRITFEDNGKKAKDDELVDVEAFIGVKGIKAKGKRATAGGIVKTIEFIEPLQKEAPTNIDITLDDEDISVDQNDISDGKPEKDMSMEETADGAVEESKPTSDTALADPKKKDSLKPGDVVDLDIGDELTLF